VSSKSEDDGFARDREKEENEADKGGFEEIAKRMSSQKMTLKVASQRRWVRERPRRRRERDDVEDGVTTLRTKWPSWCEQDHRDHGKSFQKNRFSRAHTV